MNQSSILSSCSDSSFLNQSLLNQIPDFRVERIQDEGKQSYEVVFKKDLISKYPLLFIQTIKILQQRCLNPDIKRLASQYRQIYDSLHQQENWEINQENQICHPALLEHQRLKNQLENIQKGKRDLIEEIQKNQHEKRSNRQKLKRLTKIIRQALQTQDQNPFNGKIDDEYLRQIQKIIKFSQEEGKKSLLGMGSQDPEIEFQNETKAEQARINRMKMQIERLQSQKQSFQKITQKQKELDQKEKEKLSQFKGKIQNIYKQIGIQPQENIKLNIIEELVQKFIDKQTKNEEFNQGLDKPMEELQKNVEQLKSYNSVLKDQLQQHSLTHSEKQENCALLQKKLDLFKKEKALAENKKNKQAQIQDEISSHLMNNEEMIFKTYHFEGNRILSENSQIENQYKSQELSAVLQQKSKNYIECNRKISVKKENQGLIGQVKKILGIKDSKQFLKIILIVWALILVCGFIQKMLIHFEYLPKPSSIEPANTIVHRYQGPDDYVQEKVINLDADEASFRNSQSIYNREYEQSQKHQEEVIRIEPVPERPRQHWMDTMMREYK